MINPLVTDTHCMDQLLDPIEQGLPDLDPSCAATRTMAKTAIVGGKNPQELTQFSPRSHPRHLVGKRTARNETPPKTSQATAT